MLIVLPLILLSAPVLSEMSPTQVDNYLSNLRITCPSFGARVARVARDALGTDYENGPLGEGPDGKYDQDPLIDLAHVDCVTYVEQTMALAASTGFQDAFDLLQRIRYRDGKIDFASRNHFMVTDWLRANPWCKAITDNLGTPTLTVTRTISKRGYFERVDAAELGQDIPDLDYTVTVVPPEHAAQAAKDITQPSLIVFVGKVDWLFALHCGLYVPDGAGGGKLYHASSAAGEVVAVDLAEYMTRNQKRYLGFAAYAIGEPRWGTEKEARDEAA